MTTIDKIRAEIERRITDNTFGAKLELMDILSFLDTLEEPVSEDLEDEIKKFIEEYGYERGEDKLLIAIVARHFAEWGAEHLRDTTKKISEDLEEAADEYASRYDAWNDNQDIAEYAFKAGAEWQKAKMMEGAVEGTVIELGETYKDLSLSVNAKELNQVLQPLGVGDGNKVKIIIVKEEEQ